MRLPGDNSPRPDSTARRLFRFLGSMDLAITLLLTLAVASVIGTVLQQNQPYTDYVIKFGPYWFEVFEALGLYDVYSAVWFLAILTLLVISTSVCLIRHTPLMLKDMRHMRTNVQHKSLRAMHHRADWLANDPPAQVADELQSAFKTAGFRTRRAEKGNALVVSAMRGGVNRLGYILTHLAIVVICVGGLMDGNLPLKLAEWQGKIQVETRDLALRDIPDESRLSVGEQAFRGSVTIPEGRASEVTFLQMRDGYVVQPLPFRIEVLDFRIEHYDNGQPKSFESDLRIHDPDREQPLEQTIAVNHPLIYGDYAIYQSSFGDGGSKLDVSVWPLDTRAGTEPMTLETQVFEQRQLQWGEETLQIEMNSFDPFNVNASPTEDNPRAMRDVGPSMTFKIRQPNGEALEYENYMFPVNREGRDFFLSGVRSSPSDNFAYLYIPVDADGGIEGFVEFAGRLRDDALVKAQADEMTTASLADLPVDDEALQKNLSSTLQKLVSMFSQGGFGRVRDFIDNTLPETERETLAPAYLSMLREMLGRIYFAGTGESTDTADEDELMFLQDSVDAFGTLPEYGSPVYLQLNDFEHIQATGLQIARTPGKNIVYLGCFMLIAGVFIMFYLPQRRFWTWLESTGQGDTQVLAAGMTNRNPREFDSYFESIIQRLRAATEAGNSNGTERS